MTTVDKHPNCIRDNTFCLPQFFEMQYLHEQAFRVFLVSPALFSKLNVHNSVGLSHVKCKILTYFVCDVIHLFALVFRYDLIGYPERCLWKKNEKFIWLSLWDIAAPW